MLNDAWGLGALLAKGAVVLAVLEVAGRYRARKWTAPPEPELDERSGGRDSPEPRPCRRAQSSASDIDDDVVLAVEGLGKFPAIARPPFRSKVMRIATPFARPSFKDNLDAQLVRKLLSQTCVHGRFRSIDDDQLHPAGIVTRRPSASPGVAPGATRSMSGSDALMRMHAAK